MPIPSPVHGTESVRHATRTSEPGRASTPPRAVANCSTRRRASPRVAPGDDIHRNQDTLRHLDVIDVAHDRLDALSEALAAAPLSGEALAHLIRGGFACTALASPMAETLVDDALPLLIPPGSRDYAIWRDALVHALLHPRDIWELECLSLRSSLSARQARRSPLFSWMRDALYRPVSLPADTWHAHLAAVRHAQPAADVQSIARAYQETARAAERNFVDIETRLRTWLPALDDAQVSACMGVVSQQSAADDDLLDIRMALPTALDQLGGGDDAVRGWLADARGGADAMGGIGAPAGHCPVAAALLEASHEARLFAPPGALPEGRYDTWPNALASVLRWPGQLQGVIDATACGLRAAARIGAHEADIGARRPADATVGNRTAPRVTSDRMLLEDPLPFMLAGALTGPGAPTEASARAWGPVADAGALQPLAPSVASATVSRNDTAQVMPWRPRLDPRGDVLIMHAALRQAQHAPPPTHRRRRPIDADRLFVPVSEHSPAAAFVSQVSAVLTHLKLAIARNGQPADRDDLPAIATSGLRVLLDGPLKKLDVGKPLNLTLMKRGQMTRLRVSGTNRQNRTESRLLSDIHVHRIHDYLAHLQAIRTVTPMGVLAVRDDGHVSLTSMLAFYGIDLPNEATADDLRRALADLRPKAVSIAEAGNRPRPTTAATLVIDPVNIPAPLLHEYDAGGSSDYAIIAEHIVQVCEKAHGDEALPVIERFGSSGEDMLLRGLRQAGGIALTLTLHDTDGEDDTYVEHHAVNPQGADTLQAYFDEAARLLGDYMIGKIRDRDGEDEGDINIGRLALQLHRPAFSSRTFPVTTRDVRILDIRTRTPPFLPADPTSADIDTNVETALGDFTEDLRRSNGDPARSATFLSAARRVLEDAGVVVNLLPDDAAATAITDAVEAVQDAYYRVSSGHIEKLQRLLIALQPTEEEFLGRAICEHLGMDASQWPVAIAHSVTMTYATGPENTGSLLRGDDIASRTLLELVYDQRLRTRIALATDRARVCSSIAANLASACVKPCDEARIAGALNDFFLGFNALDVVTGVSNGALPGALRQPGPAFALSNARYIDEAVAKYASLEAERIVLVSPDAARRVKDAGQNARLRAGPSVPVDFRTALADAERVSLERRTARFRGLLTSRRNTDRFADLKPGWEQAARQLQAIGMEVCRNAPLQACMAVNLLDAIVEGADAETTVVDGLFFVSSMLHALNNAPLRKLGALLQQGTNAWTLEKSVQAYRSAVKEGRYGDADKSLANIIMSGHAALASGAALIEYVHGRITAADLEAAGRAEQADRRLFDEPVSSAPEGAARNEHYRVVDPSGTLESRGTGREIVSSLWDGDLLVDGGARAIKLTHEGETVYMLGGHACQAVRGPFGALELRPMQDMPLNAHRWQRTTGSSSATYSRKGVPAFPEGFSGAAVSSHTSPRNAAAWYDNHGSTLDSIQARHFDADGSERTPTAVRIGVLENKYVTDEGGVLEVLEHGGQDDGQTMLIRADGSAFRVEAALAPSPTYAASVAARVVATQGMFAAVEVAGAIQGLMATRKVGGVIAKQRSGSQELIIEVDNGVHYRGQVPACALPPIAAGEAAGHVQPFVVAMQKLSAAADAKRASPAVWREHGAYRDSDTAHDDFALELLFGARLANSAYARHYPWVLKQHGLIASMEHALPPEVRDTANPYYQLETTKADAILFAPRNRAVLADTLIANDVRWGAISSSSDVAFVDMLLRDIEVVTADHTGVADATPTRSPLLEPDQSVTTDARAQAVLREQIAKKLGGVHVVIAEVELKTSKKAFFVGVTRADEAGVAVNTDEASAGVSTARPDILVKATDKYVHGIFSGSIIDPIETRFPRAADIRAIRVFSPTTLSGRVAGDVFVSSTNGYPYESITHFAAGTDAPTDGAGTSVDAPGGIARGTTVHATTRGIGDSEPIAHGEKKGAYLIDGRYYVQLDTGVIYLAQWDPRAAGFRLLSETANDTPIEALPLARMSLGAFRLTNAPSPAAMTPLRPADLQRLRNALDVDPTPPVLQGIRQHGADTIIVADTTKVTHVRQLDGGWALMVDGVEYHPVLTPEHGMAYARDNPEDAMAVGCARHARGIEPLCSGGSGTYIESQDAVKAADLPAEGTDQPEADDWTPWSSDTRVYLAEPAGGPPGPSRGVRVVPYEGRYCKINPARAKPVPVKKTELVTLGLPPSPSYEDTVQARVLRRQGHGAQVRIRDFDRALIDSTMDIGASIFRRKGTDTEWIVVHYDGTWYQGSMHRPAGHASAQTVAMRKMLERELAGDEEREIQRLHTGMQNANYHAKASTPAAMMDILAVSRHLGIEPAQFERSEYFDTTTTAGEAYLFDRSTREQVQTRERTDAAWQWLRLDQVGSSETVAAAREDMLQISRAVFADQSLETIEDLLNMSADRKGPLGARNFLIFRVNAERIYVSVSGVPDEATTPALFKEASATHIDVSGTSQAIEYIDADPNMQDYMDELDRSMDYPRALPTAATPEQIELAPSAFDITGTRQWDTERKMIAYLTYGRPGGDRTPVTSVEVLNRNDACKSCALILQHYFKQVPRVIHFYVNEYTKY